MTKRDGAILIFFFSLLISFFFDTMPSISYAQGKELETPKKGGMYRRPLEFSPKNA